MSHRSSLRRMPYWLLSPAVLATLIVVFYPMLQAGITSLYYEILWKPKATRFIGLDNFIAIARDPVFWASLGRTALWIGITVPLQLALGFVTALLLNQQFRWRTLARSLILIPWALPSVVIGLMWSWIYHPQVGLLNDLLLRVGMLNSAIPWLADPATALYSIIAALVLRLASVSVRILSRIWRLPMVQTIAMARRTMTTYVAKTL
jgi:multiple sugar transport system permease protein